MSAWDVEHFFDVVPTSTVRSGRNLKQEADQLIKVQHLNRLGQRVPLLEIWKASKCEINKWINNFCLLNWNRSKSVKINSFFLQIIEKIKILVFIAYTHIYLLCMHLRGTRWPVSKNFLVWSEQMFINVQFRKLRFQMV